MNLTINACSCIVRYKCKQHRFPSMYLSNIKNSNLTFSLQNDRFIGSVIRILLNSFHLSTD